MTVTATLAKQPASQRPTAPAVTGKRKLGASLLTLPATVWVLGVFAVPTAFLLASSVLSYEGASVSGHLTLENYATLFGDAYIRSVMWSTVWMSVTVGLLCTLSGLLVAHYIVRSTSRLRAVVLLIVVMPLVSSVVVRTYGWLVLLQDDGLVNQVLLGVGLVNEPVAFIGSKFAVIIGLVHVLLPFAVFTAMSSLHSVDPALERASRNLGAGPVGTFFRITLPLIRPGLISGFLLTFAISLGAYAAPAILGGGRVQTLPTLIRERMIVSLEWGQAAALSVIILIIGASGVAVLLLLGRRSPRGGA